VKEGKKRLITQCGSSAIHASTLTIAFKGDSLGSISLQIVLFVRGMLNKDVHLIKNCPLAAKFWSMLRLYPLVGLLPSQRKSHFPFLHSHGKKDHSETDQITSELLHTGPSSTPAFRSWWRFGKVWSMDDYLSWIAPLRPSARPAYKQFFSSCCFLTKNPICPFPRAIFR